MAEGVYMNTNTRAMNEILQHDAYIGTVLDCAEDVKNIKNSSIQSTQNRVMKGIESKHDYRMMYSAQHSEEDWAAFAERYGLDSVPTYHPQCKVDIALEKPSSAKIKKMPKVASYAPATKRNEKFIKAFIYRLKLEDELDIAPINNPYSGKDTTQLIKITGYEFRKPYLIISAISADDEHDRLTQTRSMDEVSQFYFTFTIAYDENGREHPDMARLRRFIWQKVDHNGKQTLGSMLRQLIGRVMTISLIPKVQKGKNLVDNPDYLGFPSWTFEDKIEEDSTHSCDHVGSYSNLPLRSFKSATNSQLIANA